MGAHFFYTFSVYFVKMICKYIIVFLLFGLASASPSVACLNTTHNGYARSIASAGATTLTGSVPVECEEYQILDDYTRNTRCGRFDHDPAYYCDDNESSEASPDWKTGDQWYRFLPPAGLVMPESHLKAYQCATFASGYLQDSPPQQEGESKVAKVCFSGDQGTGPEYDCYWSIDVKVTNCKNFYVYFLPNVPICHCRYCGSETF